MKLPAFQFYPGDWLKDPAVRAVSLTARGLWIDMLCLMHESSRRGYLQHESGLPVSASQLARMTGCETAQVEALLSELKSVGVFSCAEHGIIYSRRMVRDEEVRKARAAGGALGGNPQLLKNRRKVNHIDNHPPNLEPTPSSSSSSSPSQCTNAPPYPPGGESPPAAAESVRTESVRRRGKSTLSQCEAIYRHYPRKVGREAAVKAIARAIERLAKSRDDPDAYLLERTAAYAASPAGQSPPAGANDYRPHPSTWFNHGRYDDDPSTWQRSNGVSGTDQRDTPGRVRAPAGKYAHLSRHQAGSATADAQQPTGGSLSGSGF